MLRLQEKPQPYSSFCQPDITSSMSAQPTIRVEHFSVSPHREAGRGPSPAVSSSSSHHMHHQQQDQSRHQHHRRGDGGSSGGSGSPTRASPSGGGSHGGGGHHGHRRHHGQDRKPHSPTREHPPPSGAGSSMLSVRLPSNHHVRRKSSPAIGGLPLFHPGPASDSGAAGGGVGSPSRGRKGDSPNPLGLDAAFLSQRQASPGHQRRRLSSPPSYDSAVFTSSFGPGASNGGGGGGNGSGGSNASSGHGSTTHIHAISGLNASSTDVRENTVRSGHQSIRTLYEANNVVYPESFSINLMNAPDNSTTQCDCGHINCPFCNLMMNLELTDPTVLK